MKEFLALGAVVVPIATFGGTDFELGVTGVLTNGIGFSVLAPQGLDFVMEWSGDMATWHPLFSLLGEGKTWTNLLGTSTEPRMFLRAVENLPHAPDSLTNRTIWVNISEGRSPFASNGSYFLEPHDDGKTYCLVGDNVFIATHCGSYTYKKTAEAVADLIFRADFIELAGTATLNFTSREGGEILIIQYGGSGYQSGEFHIGPPVKR